MSNLEVEPREAVVGGEAAQTPARELLEGREVVIGTRGMVVTRTLPHKERRMVGAWCFLDHYGPEDISGHEGMRVPPHPHTGLQTVSWLVAGDVFHRDSLGNAQLIRPGQLNLMTAGRAISHSEESPRAHEPILHGVQLWVALPDGDRETAPDFAHHPDLPVLVDGGVTVTVLMGELDGARSPARTYTPIVGAEVALPAGAEARLPLRADFEYAALPLDAAAEVDGITVAPAAQLYLGCGRTELRLRATAGPARILLLGGEPFEERIIMWWNFVGRGHDEIVRMREEWEAGRGFGTVRGYDGDRLPAPPMPTSTLRPRGRLR